MITGPEEIKLGYLLDPCFQLVNTAGKPLTNGYLEVYYHGTRNKYYCSSDFNGTLHPFRIPLDSLGSNIVLADPEYSYDIYVYNSFGSLVMSRYNVSPGEGGGSGSSTEEREAENWSSDPQGGASTEVSKNTAIDLTLPSSSSTPEFVDHLTSTAIYLKEGLYIVDAAVSFRQDEADLENLIRDLKIETGLTGWDSMATSQRNWSGPEATDNDRHFVSLQFIYHVGESQIQPLYFNLRSPVDLDSAKIEKLNIVKLTAGGGGYKYTAGYGIDITGQVISTSGMMPESSASRFVDIDDYHNEVSGIYEAIDEVSGAIPSLDGYATEDWVENYTSAFITSADIHQGIFEAVYGTTTFEAVGQAIQEGKTVFCSYNDGRGRVYKAPLSSSGYGRFIFSCDSEFDVYEFTLTAGNQWSIKSRSILEPSDVVSSAELEQYVEEATSGFITSAYIDGYATESWVEEYVSENAPQSDWTESDSADASYIQNKPEPTSLIQGDNITLTETSSGIRIDAEAGVEYSAGQYISIQNNIITASGLQPEGDYLTQSDLEGYATEQYVEDSTSAFITSADLPDVSDMATKTWVGQQGYLTSLPEDLVTSGELATVSGNIMNEIPDTSDMATKTWVGQQGYLTSIPSEYVTDSELESAISGKADTSAIPDVSNFVTQEDIDRSVSGKMDSSEASAFYPMATNPSGYLVSSDLNGYATETYVQDETSAFITSADLPSTEEVQFEELDLSSFVDSAYVTSYVDSAVSGKQDTLTFGYDESDKINAINGSAIAGGGEVPADVVTSGELATVSGEIMSKMPTQTTVSIDPKLSSGTKIAEFNINGTSGELFAPEGGGSGGSEIFIAEYEVTPFSDILDAINSGKIVYATTDGADRYQLAYCSDTSIDFVHPSGGSDNLGISVLTVYTWGWANIAQGQTYTVPSPSYNQGYVLTENGDGTVVWAAPAGGGSYTEGTGIDITNDVISVTSAVAMKSDLPDMSTYATQTWTSQNFFPIDGLQIVGSSAEASGANIIYIVSGSNA